jgi:hypothetical protein
VNRRSVSQLAAASIIVGGLGLMVFHYFAGTPDDPEGWFAAIGFGSPFVAAGTLGLIGSLRKRPALMLAAGVTLVPMSLLSIVLIPLLIPAAVLVAQGAKLQFDESEFLVPGISIVALLTVMAVLVFHKDPVTWSSPTGGGGSSDIITATEAFLAISVGTAVIAAALFATRRSQTKGAPGT